LALLAERAAGAAKTDCGASPVRITEEPDLAALRARLVNPAPLLTPVREASTNLNFSA